MHGILDELDCLGCAILDEWFVLDPFDKLVNGHKNILETTLGFLEGPYLIQPLVGERLSKRNTYKVVCWDVSLSCKHLVALALFDEFFHIF
jgi:hypothetical protein